MVPVEKLQSLARRLEEVEALLCDMSIVSNPTRLRQLGRERSSIQAVVDAFQEVAECDQASQRGSGSARVTPNWVS